MKKVMIVGAHGATAQILTKRLLNETDDELILFLRNAKRLDEYSDNKRVTLVDGDVLETTELANAMKPADIIYSNVGGTNLADQTESILASMRQTNKQRLNFISALGAHHELSGKFGQWNEQAIAAFLPGFRKSAQLLIDSGVIYTEIRPSWLTNNDEIDYEEKNLNQPLTGTEVSRASVADFALKVINNPEQYQKASVGLSKPNTNGDKPSWM